MNLYKLERKDNPGYDEYDGFVIAANDHDEARKLANGQSADEGQIWDKLELVRCSRIGETTYFDRPHIILSSFCAG